MLTPDDLDVEIDSFIKRSNGVTKRMLREVFKSVTAAPPATEVNVDRIMENLSPSAEKFVSRESVLAVLDAIQRIGGQQ